MPATSLFSSSPPHILSRFAVAWTFAAVTVFSAASISAAEGPVFAPAAQAAVTYASAEAGSASEIWRALSRVHNFDVVFSPKMKDPKIAFEVKDAALGVTLDRLAIAGSHFWLALDERTVLVANDTPRARREYEPQAVQTFRLENLRVADAVTAMRSIFGVKHITVDEERQTLTARDFAGKLSLAEDLLMKIDVPEDEVSIELQLVRVPEAVWRESDTARRGEFIAKQASPLLRTDLGIVGRRKARFETKQPVAGDQITFGLEFEARVHPANQEVTLALESHFIRGDSSGGAVTESKATSSTWRVASGETRFIELPGGFADSNDVLALVMTPRIERVGTAETTKAQWISAAAPLSSSDTEATAEVKKRLKERLAELPREKPPSN